MRCPPRDINGTLPFPPLLLRQAAKAAQAAEVRQHGSEAVSFFVGRVQLG